MAQGSFKDNYIEILFDVSHIWTWQFDKELKLVTTNCHLPYLCSTILFENVNMPSIIGLKEADPPLIISNDMGLMYSIIRGTEFLWVLGPVHTSEISNLILRKRLRRYRLKKSELDLLVQCLSEVPLVTSASFFEKTISLYRLLFGKMTYVSDFTYHKVRIAEMEEKDEEKGINQSRAYHEELLLEHVRNGNIDYRKTLSRVITGDKGLTLDLGDSFEHARYSVATFIAIVTRAAIQGGLPASTAYDLEESYIKALSSCRTIGEITELSHTMYRDFIYRVHRIKVEASESKAVRIAADYMTIHAEDTITLETLSALTGLTPYYISRKFKEEMKETPFSYLQKVRIEKAKILLSDTELPITDIALHLRFCSRSYFSNIFKKLTGQSPAEYRMNN